MKSYKDFEKQYIGSSDIASLILVGCDKDGLSLKELHFGQDASYQAYVIEGEAEIGSHYHKVAEFESWMKIYDDEVDFDVDKLENDAEYMYHRGFCESSKQWMKCLGISPDSPIIEIMVREHMK